MATEVMLGKDLMLDVGEYVWPFYRGSHAVPITLTFSLNRYTEVKKFADKLKGSPTTLTFKGVKKPGPSETGAAAQHKIEINNVFVTKVKKKSSSVEVVLKDCRCLLEERVGSRDFNMRFGQFYLRGTATGAAEARTYGRAIHDYVRRQSGFMGYAAPGATSALFNGPVSVTRYMEENVYLSAMRAPDPLAYLCDRGGVDLTVGEDGLWYFAERRHNSSHFSGWADLPWINGLPGFLNNEAKQYRIPKKFRVYSWIKSTFEAAAVDANTTAPRYGPEELVFELEQTYRYNGTYFTLEELIAELGVPSITDAQIAKHYFIDSAEGTPLYPLATRERVDLWSTIQRDWRNLYRFSNPLRSLGGWANLEFGVVDETGAIDDSGSVLANYVAFFRHVITTEDGEILDQPWTRNNRAFPFSEQTSLPFRAVWENGPEQGVIRLVAEPNRDHIYEPVIGTLGVERDNNGSAETDFALRIVSEVSSAPGYEDNVNVRGREPLDRAFLFSDDLYLRLRLTGVRFMPNSEERWHMEEVDGDPEGDIDYVEIPPGEVMAYYGFDDLDRTFDQIVDPQTGLGVLLNASELTNDARRRAEAWMTAEAPEVDGQGLCDSLDLLKKGRIVNYSVQGAYIEVKDELIQTHVLVGGMTDPVAEELIEGHRLANRGFAIRGKEIK